MYSLSLTTRQVYFAQLSILHVFIKFNDKTCLLLTAVYSACIH